jgi:hypothetical protein
MGHDTGLLTVMPEETGAVGGLFADVAEKLATRRQDENARGIFNA